MQQRWVHPEIKLDDLIICVKTFVDILILAGGFLSSGDPAFWDHHNTIKAFEWALFLESVLKKIPESNLDESRKALDIALDELTSDPLFPKGLPKFSFSTLAEARKLLIRYFLQSANLTDNQTMVLLTLVDKMDANCLGNDKPMWKELAITEKVVDEFCNSKTNNYPDCRISLNVLKSGPPLPAQEFGDNFMIAQSSFSPSVTHPIQKSNICLTDCAVEETIRRFYAMNCIRSLQHGLKELLGAIAHNQEHSAADNIWESPCNSSREVVDNCETITKFIYGHGILCSLFLRHNKGKEISRLGAIRFATHFLSLRSLLDTRVPLGFTFISEEWALHINIQQQVNWKDSSLSYLLNPKTLDVASGSKLIFSAAKIQWWKVLESLKSSTINNEIRMLEMVEICLLGLCSGRWNYLIRRLMSVTYENISVSEMWVKLRELPRAKSIELSKLDDEEGIMRAEIEEYLTQLLDKKIWSLWKMPSILLACSLSQRSNFFLLYMNEIQRQIDAVSPIASESYKQKCSEADFKWDVGERIWCLYVLHCVGK